MVPVSGWKRTPIIIEKSLDKDPQSQLDLDIIGSSYEYRTDNIAECSESLSKWQRRRRARQQRARYVPKVFGDKVSENSIPITHNKKNIMLPNDYY